MSDTSSEAPVQVGGGYVENEDFVPDPTDQHATLNTSGIGAHQDPAVVSPIFEVDKKNTAAQIKAALDPEDTSVDASKVLLSTPQTVVAVDHDAEREALLAKADAELATPVVVGGTGEEGTDAEKAAAESGEAGEAAAQEQEAKTASQVSATAGAHENAPGEGGQPVEGEQGEAAPKTEGGEPKASGKTKPKP